MYSEQRNVKQLCTVRHFAGQTKFSDLPVLPFAPVSIIPPTLHTYFHLHIAFTGSTNERILETIQEAMIFRKSEILYRKVLPHFGC